ncbi:hypothetical protein [Chamaesiphon sp.]|uniref:Npun_F0813 family protein n=1 Tax=Chamaesiphon sp. TaxID=2814140 RepID=UPI003593B4A4
MSIIASQSVDIEISTLPDDRHSRLRLNDRGHIYNLLQAFAIPKLDRAQQQLQQLIELNDRAVSISNPNRYLLVREVDYYSLWELDRSIAKSSLNDRINDDREIELELQQASIWLFQELWLQWQDLLGARQLQVFAKDLLAVTPQIEAEVDLDRLLALDPLGLARLGWSRLDFMTFDRQLYQLTQKKMGRQFGTKVTLDIIQAMPDSLQITLSEVLGI